MGSSQDSGSGSGSPLDRSRRRDYANDRCRVQDSWDHVTDRRIRFRFLEVSGSNYRPRNPLRERWFLGQASPAIAGDVQGNEIRVHDTIRTFIKLQSLYRIAPILESPSTIDPV